MSAALAIRFRKRPGRIRSEMPIRCVVGLTAVGTPSLTSAQECDGVWRAGQPVRGVWGAAETFENWDPDGPGPLAPLLAVGGWFTAAGDVPARHVAAWDPRTSAWSPLGPGPYGSEPLLRVRDLLALPDGGLIGAGYFRTEYRGSADYVARWDGSIWTPLGEGIKGQVNALALMPNGQLIAAGEFSVLGKGFADRIAGWNGVEWTELGGGIGGIRATVHALQVVPSGDLIAAGTFETAGDVPASNIARWDGQAWSSLGAGIAPVPNSIVFALAALPNGELVAGGQFTSVGGIDAANIARWNGQTWSRMGEGLSYAMGGGFVRSLTTLSDGAVLAGGSFSNSGSVAANNLARWDGAAWHSLDVEFDSEIDAVAQIPDGRIVVGGFIDRVNGVAARGMAVQDGKTWNSANDGPDGAIRSIVRLATAGDFIFYGDFTSIGGTSASRIARWTGDTFFPLGAGLDDTPRTALVTADGRLIVGGDFIQAGDELANRIAGWDGENWSSLGAGFDGPVYALTLLPDGALVAGGEFSHAGGVAARGIARWDGIEWTPVGSLPGVPNPRVRALAELPDGRLIAGGMFGEIYNWGIARWNGQTWAQVGNAFDYEVLALQVDARGDLLVGGRFRVANGLPAYGIVLWRPGPNGYWTTFGDQLSGDFHGFTALPDGEIVALGRNVRLAGQPVTSGMVRWNGGTWRTFASEIDGVVHAVQILDDGVMAVGGDFARAGPHVSAYFAQLDPDRPPQFVEQPSSRAACRGESTVFEARGDGGASLSYRWQRYYSAIGWYDLRYGWNHQLGILDGVLSPRLVVEDISASETVRLRCIVENSCGSLASEEAILTPCDRCSGEVICDCTVELADLATLLAHFGQDSGATADEGDLTGDGRVDLADLNVLLGGFGGRCD